MHYTLITWYNLITRPTIVPTGKLTTTLSEILLNVCSFLEEENIGVRIRNTCSHNQHIRWTNSSSGMVVPSSENVKFFTATRDNATTKERSTKDRGGVTYESQWNAIAVTLWRDYQSYAFGQAGFGPAFRFDYLFLPKSLHVLREGGQVVERMHKSLQSKFRFCRFNAKMGPNHSPLPSSLRPWAM